MIELRYITELQEVTFPATDSNPEQTAVKRQKVLQQRLRADSSHKWGEWHNVPDSGVIVHV